MAVLPEKVDWQLLVHREAFIGETPIYDPDRDALYWISQREPSLNRTALADGATVTWHLPALVGSYALYDDGSGAIIASERGIDGFDFDTGTLTPMHDAPFDSAIYQFNDGRTDPAGRFWVGTFRKHGIDAPAGSGHFYRVEGESMTPQIGGVTIANGTAFSPDGRIFYAVDRINERILMYDYDVETGRATGERVFATVGPADVPDGAAMDAAGGYWVAMFGRGEIWRFTPDGQLDRVITAPVARPTMCAFGGPDLDRLFLTTARIEMSDAELAAQPLAGGVFVADVGATGIPEPRFPTPAHSTQAR